MKNFLMIIFLVSVSFSQIKPEKGLPFIKNYSRHIYGMDALNDAIIQDKKGTLFFGNKQGLLSFNGSQWQKIPMPNVAPIKSLAIDSSNRIYIGGKGNFGFMEKDNNGNYQYRSLSKRLDSVNQNFRYIWYIKFLNDTVFFQTRQYLFYYTDDSLYIYKTSTRFHSLNKINNKLYTREYDYGLKYWSHDSLLAMKNGDFFHGSSPYFALKRKNGKILYGNRRDGIIETRKNNFNIIRSDLTEEIRTSLIYRGIKTSDQLFAIATLGNGLYLLDESINKEYHLNKKSGLISTDLKYVFKAKDQSIWIASNKGISRVEHQNPFRIFDARLGFEGTVERIFRFNNTLYVSHNNGVSYWNGERFEVLQGINNLVFDYNIINSNLFVAAQNGIYKIQNNLARQFNSTSSYDISSLLDGQVITAVGRDGLSLIKNHNIIRIPGFNYEIIRVIKESEHRFWIISGKKINYMEINDKLELRELKTVLKKKNEPNFFYNSISKIDSNIYLLKADGLYIYDKISTNFIKERFFNQWIPKPNEKISLFQRDYLGNYWIRKANKTALLRYKTKNKYLYDDKEFNRLSNYQPFTHIYHDKSGHTWLGSSEGLIKYNPGSKTKRALGKTFIHSITLGQDSTVLKESNQIRLSREIDYNLNSLRFTFSIPAYDEPEKNQFQYYLEGEMNTWSSWSGETFVNFSNLFEGEYSFRVRAKDIYDNIYSEASVNFQIAAPYYRSHYAYLLYLLGLATFIYFLIRLRTQKIQKEKEILEGLVSKRTRELELEKEKVEKQAKQLQELDRVKTNFFSNISHEFRTPLTLILGPIQNLIRSSSDKNLLNEYGIIRDNASRLLNLINQLLDISKLENDQFPLRVSKDSLNIFIKGIIKTFKPLTDEKQIQLSYKSGDELSTYFDRNILERIILNLLSNAIKFTDYGGKITIQTSKSGENIVLSIKDTGIGIAEDKISHIFDRFYQIDSSNKRKYSGSGIGLAFTKELVERHYGKITVQSKENSGTEFNIIIPAQRTGYKDNEILEKTNPYEFDPEKLISIQAEIHEQTENFSEKDPVSNENYCILIVEDNLELRNYLSNSFSEYKISTAKNGEEAIEKLSKEMPDLILSDVMMPKLSGDQLCKQLKSNIEYSHLPIILLTAKSSDKSKLEGLKTGADDYVTKPFNLDELKLRVRNQLENRQKVKDKFSGHLLPDIEKLALSSTDETFLLKINKIIIDNAPNATFGVNELSNELGMSRVSLNRKLNAITNKQPTKYILSVKLSHAEKLLRTSQLSSSEIAYHSGFQSLSYFTKVFKSEFGETPAEYQKQNNETIT